MSEFSIYGQTEGHDMTLMGRVVVESPEEAAVAIPGLLRTLADVVAHAYAEGLTGEPA